MALTISTSNVSTRVDEIGLAFNENTANGIIVGTIRGLDPNLTYDWGRENDTPIDGGGRYRLVARTENGETVLDIVTVVPDGTADVFNYEGARQHELKIVGKNGTGAAVDEGDFFFQMRDVNEAPTNIRLAGRTNIEVVEGTMAFGDLTSDDQDDFGVEYLGHEFSFAPNGNPDGLFAFSGDEENGYRLVLAANKTLDYESATIQTEGGTGRKYYDVIINVTDDGGISGGTPLTTQQTFRVYVTNNPGDDLPVNSPPVIGGVNPSTQSVEDTGIISPFSGVTINDNDSASLTVTIKMDTATEGAFENLGIGSYDAATGTYTVTGTAHQVQGAIQALIFNPADRPTGGVGAGLSTTFTISVDDGVNAPVTNSQTTVNATVANRAPTLDAPAATHNADANATTGLPQPFLGVTINDTNAGDQITVTIRLDDTNKGAFTLASIPAGATYQNGVFTFTGTASAAQSAIRGLVFNPTDKSGTTPTSETTSFTITVRDNAGVQVDSIGDIRVNSVYTPSNPAPTLGGVTATVQTVTDLDTINPFQDVTIGDNGLVTVTIRLDNNGEGVFTPESLQATGFGFSNGVYTLSNVTAETAQAAIRGLVFDPQNRSDQAVGTGQSTTFEISVSDGVNPAVTNNHTTVNATVANRNPTINAPNLDHPIDEKDTVSPFTAVTIGDTNAGDRVTVTVRLDDFQKGVFTAASLAESKFVHQGNGIYVLSGVLPGDAQSAIRQLVFAPHDDSGPASTRTTRFTIEVEDNHGGSVSVANTTVTATHTPNTQPTITVNGTTVFNATDIGPGVSPFSGVVIGDDSASLTLEIRFHQDHGELEYGSSPLNYVDTAGTRIYTFTGSVGLLQGILGGLKFNPYDRPAAQQADITTGFIIRLSDGGGGAPAENQDISVVTDILGNIAPTAEVAEGTELTRVLDGSLLRPFNGLDFGDAEHGLLTLTITFRAADGQLVVPDGITHAPPTTIGDDPATQLRRYTFTGEAAALEIMMDVLGFKAIANATPGEVKTTDFALSLVDNGVLGRQPIVRTVTVKSLSQQVGATGEISELTAVAGQKVDLTPGDTDGNAFTYDLINDAGGRFKLGSDGRSVVVANANLIDYEQAKSHTIQVKVTTENGLSFTDNVVINVADVVREETRGTAGSDVYVGGGGSDYLRGNAGNDRVNGGSGNDMVYGDSGNDLLYGGVGNDRIYGGLGNDKLYGQTGRDIFVFDANKPSKSKNLDTIYDYKAKDDTIWLDNKYMSKLGRSGSEKSPAKLNKNFFTIGDKAKDKDDYLVYSKKTKTLYYDSDGSGSKKAVEIFKFAKDVGKELKYTEFFII